MKDRIPAFVAIFILVVLVITTKWAADYAENAIPTDPQASKEHKPSSVSGPFVMVTSDDKGIPENRLDGERFRYYTDDNTYEIDNAKSVSQKTNQPRMTGTADFAKMLDDGNTIQLVGNAHLKRFPYGKDKQLDIYSEELFIYPHDDIVKSNIPTTVVQDKSTLKGNGIIYNNQTRKLKVINNSNVNLNDDDLNRGHDKQKNKPANPSDTRVPRKLDGSPVTPSAAPQSFNQGPKNTAPSKATRTLSHAGGARWQRSIALVGYTSRTLTTSEKALS
ncbi:LPS export ABC transporter periplasmic protein LptC [Brackiella oedipodis]|uniref:LPS export ABC transporter periplasmic protein LptC n=1 Tax=Brackiella oedipodis TaxID=124225 RepID=UPI000684A6B3|nr:LPS export ABC transporter periplasmic protein LptC [Brackiella oedipodis]